MMTAKIFLYVAVHSLLFITVLCYCERYWKRYYFNNTRIVDNNNMVRVTDGQECVETCVNATNCNSVGISVITGMIECYLYPVKVYSGMAGLFVSNVVYYIPMKPPEEIALDYQCFYNESFCYKFYHSITKSWIESESICEEDGGSLFLANSQFKLNLVHHNLVNHFGVGVAGVAYLGATDIHDEGRWNWFNGDPVNHSLFIPGSPDNYQNNQHCMCYRIHNASVSGLEDKTCTVNGNFICEIILKDG